MIANIIAGRQNIPTSVCVGDPRAVAARARERDRCKPGTAAALVDEIDAAVRIVRFDVPGVGGSPLPPRPYRFTGLARLLNQVLDHGVIVTRPSRHRAPPLSTWAWLPTELKTVGLLTPAVAAIWSTVVAP